MRRLPCLAVMWLAVPMLLTSPLYAEPPTKEQIDDFLSKISSSHERLHNAGVEFGKTMSPIINEEDVDVMALNRAYRHAARTLGKVYAETKTWTVPDNDTARELNDANQRFLDNQMHVILCDLPSLLDVFEDEQLDNAAKKKQVLDMLNKGETAEKDVGGKVRDLWVKLADEFEIER